MIPAKYGGRVIEKINSNIRYMGTDHKISEYVCYTLGTKKYYCIQVIYSD